MRPDYLLNTSVRQVTTRGPIVNWTQVGEEQRILHVMRLLVDTYRFSANAAAGIVGSLVAESGILPTKIESTGRLPAGATPLTERGFGSRRPRHFTPEEIMGRREPGRGRRGVGPRTRGIGIAQWTTEPRRSGLFQHTYHGRRLGAAILFDIDAQVDYVVHELRTVRRFQSVYRLLTRRGVSLNAASDEVVYRYEVPGSILDRSRPRPHPRLPRTAAAVQRVFQARRANAQRALRIYNEARDRTP